MSDAFHDTTEIDRSSTEKKPRLKRWNRAEREFLKSLYNLGAPKRAIKTPTDRLAFMQKYHKDVEIPGAVGVHAKLRAYEFYTIHFVTGWE